MTAGTGALRPGAWYHEEAARLTDRDTETPEDDAAEQQMEAVDPGEDGDEEFDETPLEADPADAAEQQRAVSPGDDEYR
jgi:hypothetical protein